MTIIIPDRHNTNIPMTETHYYKWLKEQGKTNVHSIATKMEYLKSLGFVFGVDAIGDTTEEASRDLTTLRSIENHYYYMEVLKKGE